MWWFIPGLIGGLIGGAIGGAASALICIAIDEIITRRKIREEAKEIARRMQEEAEKIRVKIADAKSRRVDAEIFGTGNKLLKTIRIDGSGVADDVYNGLIMNFN